MVSASSDQFDKRGALGTDSGAQPLCGVEIVTTGEIYPGPFATMILADLGATVTMLERPTGDPGRNFPSMFDALNRGKRSLALDLRTAAGLDLARRVISTADVFVESARPDVMDRLGLGYAALSAQAPHLIYLSMTAFGRNSTMRDRPAHDLSVQAIAGILEGGGVDSGPHVPRLPHADLASAAFAVVGILAALHRRNSTGIGGLVEVSMIDALATWQSADISPLLCGDDPTPMPPSEPAYWCFRTSDGRFLSISISYSDSFWRRLCLVLDEPQMANLTASERHPRIAELRGRIKLRIGQATSDHWSSLFENSNIPFGVVQNHHEFAEYLSKAPHQQIRTDISNRNRRFVGSPVRFDDQDLPDVTPAPLVGEHSLELLAEAGISVRGVHDAATEGVVYQASAQESPDEL